MKRRRAKTRQQSPPTGRGATEPVLGLNAQHCIERLLGMPMTAGYSRCALTLGLTAAEKLLMLAADGVLHRKSAAKRKRRGKSHA